MKVEKLLSKAVINAMAEKKMNKVKLGEQTGLSYPTIVGICKGETTSTATINKVMKVLDMKVTFTFPTSNDDEDED